MELSNRVAVVTGGASGIGKACCRAFAAGGARVAVVDRDVAGAEAVAAEIGGIAATCDVGDEASITAALDRHRARARHRSRSASTTPASRRAAIRCGPTSGVWDEQWAINVMSHVYAIRRVLPGMLERGEGYILHTASMAGILTSHGNATYATTKHAVVGLAEWMSITYHDRGVRTSLLAPLGVRHADARRDAARSLQTVAGPLVEPEDVATLVVDAIARSGS